MLFNSVGFIGGGRITRIMLRGFQKAGVNFSRIIVSDVNLANLEKLKENFPEICISYNNNIQPAEQDLVFISVHPPVISSLLSEIKSGLKPESIIVSLAPKITIQNIISHLDGFNRIARMNPSAPSIVNAGFNPVCFSDAIGESERSDLLHLFSALGDTPKVTEEKIEAYAVFTAMGPTYFWFQFYELQNIVNAFGIHDKEFKEGLSKMLNGTLRTMFSEFSAEEVMDLVPVKPIGEHEESIKELYRNKLNQIYNRIKP